MPNEKQAKTANPAIVAVEGPAEREPSLAEMARARKGAPGERIDRTNARRGDSRGDSDKWPDGIGGAGNHEHLPERLQAALRRLVQQYSTESESTRRQEVRQDQTGAPILARACNICGGTSGIRTGICRSSRS